MVSVSLQHHFLYLIVFSCVRSCKVSSLRNIWVSYLLYHKIFLWLELILLMAKSAVASFNIIDFPWISKQKYIYTYIHHSIYIHISKNNTSRFVRWRLYVSQGHSPFDLKWSLRNSLHEWFSIVLSENDQYKAYI